jgi:hypothetical protein
MLRAATLGLLLMATATAARADGGATGPARWLLEREEGSDLVLPPVPSSDALSRFIEHCKRNPIGLRPFVTLLPPERDDSRRAELPTIALFARAKGRTLVSLTRVQARADDGQEVVMQRTLVSDLLAGRRFSLTVYEDHSIGDTAARLMGVGTRLTFRPPGLPFRVEVLGSYDLDAGASGYLAITGVFAAPPLPVAVRR